MSALNQIPKGYDMAISIKGKSKSAPPDTDETPDTPDPTDVKESVPDAEVVPPEPAPVQGSMKSQQSGASHLMTGDNQNTAVQTVKAQQDLRTKLRGGAREFWLNAGEFAKLYFLDGQLTGDGVFDTPMVAHHMLQIGGDWVKFICNKHTEGSCIVCDSNADKSHPTTVQLFTVINTMPYKIQNGKRAGTVIPARLQLFAATLKVREKLVKKAEKLGGSLAGNMFQFSRSSQTDPRTGDDIDHEGAYPMAKVIAKYPTLGEDPEGKAMSGGPTQPFDYATAYPILTNAEIAQLRPDLAGMAGYTNTGPVQKDAFTTSAGDMSDDEIPF